MLRIYVSWVCLVHRTFAVLYMYTIFVSTIFFFDCATVFKDDYIANSRGKTTFNMMAVLFVPWGWRVRNRSQKTWGSHLVRNSIQFPSGHAALLECILCLLKCNKQVTIGTFWVLVPTFGITSWFIFLLNEVEVLPFLAAVWSYLAISWWNKVDSDSCIRMSSSR